MDRRRLFGVVGALALTGVMGIGAAAEKIKSADSAACCCGESCGCGEPCSCDPAGCGDGCACDCTTGNPAAVKMRSCCEQDVSGKVTCCVVEDTAKAGVAS